MRQRFYNAVLHSERGHVVYRAGMPNAANMPMLLERPQKDGVELTWGSQRSNGSGPILYLVSARSNVGRHFRDNDVTSWQVVTKVSFVGMFCRVGMHR